MGGKKLHKEKKKKKKTTPEKLVFIKSLYRNDLLYKGAPLRLR